MADMFCDFNFSAGAHHRRVRGCANRDCGSDGNIYNRIDCNYSTGNANYCPVRYGYQTGGDGNTGSFSHIDAFGYGDGDKNRHDNRLHQANANGDWKNSLPKLPRPVRQTDCIRS